MQAFEIEWGGKTRDGACISDKSLCDSRHAPSHRWNPLRRLHSETGTSDREREIQRQFERDLAETKLEDTQDLEMLDFIRLGNKDRYGMETLMFIAKHVPNDVLRLERTQRFMMRKLESVGRKPYSILYIHTGSNLWNSQLGLRITWNLFSRIPRIFRERLDKIYILHPDMSLQVAMWFIVRWFMHSLWDKVHYLSRLENLQTRFPYILPQLPAFVKEHDEELETHPLMDYGFITLSEVDTPSSQSGPPFYT